MIEKRVTVVNNVGLHARPAAVFVRIASGYQSDISILTDRGQADAKSLLSVLALGVTKGTQMSIIADGPDEEEALSELCTLIEKVFVEQEMES